jgi:hypothetical protein
MLIKNLSILVLFLASVSAFAVEGELQCSSPDKKIFLHSFIRCNPSGPELWRALYMNAPGTPMIDDFTVRDRVLNFQMGDSLEIRPTDLWVHYQGISIQTT